MQRRISLVALLLVVIMLMSSCALPAQNADANAQTEAPQSEQIQNDAPAVSAFTKNDSWTPVPITKTIKILTIGNEQAVDRAQYLVPMARELGIEIILGHLFINGGYLSSCSGTTNNSDAAFNYHKFSGDSWTTATNYSIRQALQEEEWNYVLLSQTVGLAGDLETIQGSIAEHYYLSVLSTYINYNTKLGGKTKYTTKMLWNMTWAFEDTATYAHFGKYDYNQEKMYNDIVSATQTALANSQVKKYVKGVIPTGTAVQNLRTSYWYDGITRDGSNLSYMGKILAAMMILRSIDVDINALTFESYEELAFAKPDLDVLKEAVNNAYAKPYEVTQSAFPRT